MKPKPSPYKAKTAYNTLFGYWRKRQVVTRQDLLAEAKKNGMTETAALATVTVLLSPREKDGRGDCRGNLSAQGHIYYAELHAPKKKGASKRFQLRWRAKELEPRQREARQAKVEAKKVKTTKTKTEVKTETATV